MSKKRMVFCFVLVLLIATISSCGNRSIITCKDQISGTVLTLEDAAEIAAKEPCSLGSVDTVGSCDPLHGQWVFRMDSTRRGCLLYCAVDIENSNASLMWNCNSGTVQDWEIP